MINMKNAGVAGAVGLGIFFLLATGASAQTAESTSVPVRIVVPVGPGGLNDMLARLLAERMGPVLKRSFIVENKPGANGNIAATYLSRAKPDGNTLLLGTSQMAGSATLYKKLDYDLKKDLAPVALLAKTPYFLAVNKDLPVKSIGELIAMAKKQPGTLTFASTGTGSGGHLLGESLQQKAGIKLTHVPFNSAGQYSTELIAGRVNMVFAGLPIIKPHVESGKLRVLAVTLGERSEFLPDVPTTKEGGGPEMDDTAWFGLFAPSHTPADLIEQYGKVAHEIVNDPKVTALLKSNGALPQDGDPAAFSKLINEDVEHKAQIIHAAGVSLN